MTCRMSMVGMLSFLHTSGMFGRVSFPVGFSSVTICQPSTLANAMTKGSAEVRSFRSPTRRGLAVFDARPVAALAEKLFPGRGDEMTALWRTRQFEYTWLRTVGRQYADFWQVTEQALAFSCESLKLELTRADSDRLMQSYLDLRAWPDALAALSVKGQRSATRVPLQLYGGDARSGGEELRPRGSLRRSLEY